MKNQKERAIALLAGNGYLASEAFKFIQSPPAWATNAWVPLLASIVGFVAAYLALALANDTEIDEDDVWTGFSVFQAIAGIIFVGLVLGSVMSFGSRMEPPSASATPSS